MSCATERMDAVAVMRLVLCAMLHCCHRLFARAESREVLALCMHYAKWHEDDTKYMCTVLRFGCARARRKAVSRAVVLRV